ncbi:MAG TPA: cytochrome c oxidase subunit 3 [Marmoricola sp.]|jgi:nitric oxide reductase NorE protein|nr:cytochrome c oxidase subunit 3 [Marmoricola sp.]
MIAPAAPSATARRIPGEEGTWVFLFGDMVVFGVFFTTFLIQRGHAPQLFDRSRQTLNLGIGLANTLVLLTSSLLVATGVRALRDGANQLARRLLVAAFGCGVLFVGLKAVEYTQKVHQGHGPGTNNFYLYYFILTGLHLFHVVIGLGALGFLIRQTGRPELTERRWMVVEGAACFWHLVDLLWIFLFPLLYLVS